MGKRRGGKVPLFSSFHVSSYPCSRPSKHIAELPIKPLPNLLCTDYTLLSFFMRYIAHFLNNRYLSTVSLYSPYSLSITLLLYFLVNFLDILYTTCSILLNPNILHVVVSLSPINNTPGTRFLSIIIKFYSYTLFLMHNFNDMLHIVVVHAYSLHILCFLACPTTLPFINDC